MASGETGHGTELKHINIAWSYNIIFFKLSYAPQFLFLHFLLFFPCGFLKLKSVSYYIVPSRDLS